MAEKCDACNGRLEEDFISDYASMAVDQRPCSKCQGTGVIERTGPYRLADGTWSDGVDRTSMIKLHKFHIENPSRPIVIQTWDQRQDGGYDWVAIESKYAEPEYFRTHAEAIAYADRMARTNQGGNND